MTSLDGKGVLGLDDVGETGLSWSRLGMELFRPRCRESVEAEAVDLIFETFEPVFSLDV